MYNLLQNWIVFPILHTCKYLFTLLDVKADDEIVVTEKHLYSEKTVASEMESSEVLEELKCPICFEIPEDKIYLCQNGHTVCDNCSTTLKICPQCRVSYENVKVRNRTLEVLLDTFKFECVHKQAGCEEQVGRKDRKSHLLMCSFNGNHIKLCKEIGYSCEFASNLLDIPAAFEHYKAEHSFIIQDELHFHCHFKNFDKAATLKEKKKPLDSMWTPLLIRHCPPTSSSKASLTPSNILLLSLIHGKDRSASWICVRLSNEKNGQKYHAQFEIKSLSKEMSNLSWRIPTIEVNQISTMLSRAPFRIPKSLLLEHYIQKDGNLLVTVKVVPLKGRRVEPRLYAEPNASNIS